MAATGLTRRALLHLIGRAGGAGAAYGALHALGLIPAPVRAAPDRPAFTGVGADRRVVILGAGLAGLTAAYELGNLGYDCRVLEARARAGGRC
ncbi:MAG TPA: NAD(P)-binding protein, partial [Thermomicrobiales bacterium]|nr:NAD(P)-binding protein [Thermomicrobiales bacterium]